MLIVFNSKDIRAFTSDGGLLQFSVENVYNVKKGINNEVQVFWVCPIIEESKKIDHQSAVKKYEQLNKIFPNNVRLLHGKTPVDQKEQILKDFLENKFKIDEESIRFLNLEE